MNERLSKHFRQVHLTPALGEVLHAVGLEGKASSSALARRLNITPQSIKQSVHALERLEYVRRTQSKEDQRVLAVQLTKSGEDALKICIDALDEMYGDVFGTLKPREMDTLTKLLVKVVRATHPETLELYIDRREAFPHRIED